MEQWKQAAALNSKLWKSPEYVWFPLRTQDIKAIDAAYDGKKPSSVSIQEIRGKYFWRGRIWVATEPKRD